MASDTLPAETRERIAGGSDESWGGLPDALAAILKPLASLKLTVACFAMAIFIVLAGTLAQIDKDIWEVMGQYFRTPLAWIPLSIFFPRSIEVLGGFYFPGGFSIGLVMLLNLFAAHAVRFKVQASGTRLLAGLGVIAAGAAMTWLVIASGSNPEGLQAVPMIPSSVLWTLSKVGLTALWLLNVHVVVNKMDQGRKLERIILGVIAAVLGALLSWLWYQGDAVALGDSSMRILWQLIKGGLASLVLLAGAIMVFRKRAGIVLLHAGVALMMLNELVVHTLHVEAQMQIREGETVNFVQDVRKLELAVVDTSNPESDQVVVVPQSILGINRGASHPLVRDAKLPFDVQVVRFVQNTDLRPAKPGEKNPADKGFGVERIVEEVRPGAGTDAGGSVDMSAAYVKFLKKDSSEPLGTYLLGLYQSFADLPETVTVDGKEYEVYLRFKRNYKPYSMHLIDVRFDRYMGTNTPKNYSSDVRLVDPSRNVDRTLKIWMNNPLRYAGETFYQSNFSQDRAGNEITGLQVVTNTGWMIPYVACMIVGTGLLAHFLIVLDRFLRRTSEMEPSAAAPSRRSRKAAAASTPSIYTWVVPLAAVVAFGGWLGSKARPPSPPRPGSDQMNLYEFGKLPLVYEGRVKPFDTLARNSLRMISDREVFVDKADEKRPAIEWLLEVITNPRQAAEYRVFRIQNLEVLDTLGLERRKHYRYAIEEFQDRLDRFSQQVEQAHNTPGSQLSVYQKKLLELDRRLKVYTRLVTAFDRPQIRPDPDHALEDLTRAIRYQRETLEKMEPPLVIPPAAPGGDWEPYFAAYLRAWTETHMLRKNPNPSTVALDNMLVSYARGDATKFNQELRSYRAQLKKNPPQNLNTPKTDFEVFFNHFRPFYHSTVLYVVAFVLACAGWLGWQGPLNRAAFWLIALAFVVHSLALVARIYISGRPPVTNLYSSAVFIGWACVALGMLLETIYGRRTAAAGTGAPTAALGLGIGNILASVLGFTTLLIADFLAADGDTFTVLQAVLDTQFWLATHVVCITLGYATTYVAGFLGIIYILAGVFTRALSPTVAKELYRMIYGIVCFAIFFSFVGTVLGGLWADDSWGRFWGWDPKENGALIIVLWNALVLHARWGGMVRERGLAVLAVFGNIAVSWSWFGVNELGAGLHSYGFTEGVALALGLFVISQAAVMIAGMLPKALWRSQAV